MGEEGGALCGHSAGSGFEEKADALVEQATLAEEEALVGDVLREALAEAVLVAREDVLAVDEAAPLELLELVADVDALLGEERGELAPRELAAEDGGDLEHALPGRAQAVE